MNENKPSISLMLSINWLYVYTVSIIFHARKKNQVKIVDQHKMYATQILLTIWCEEFFSQKRIAKHSESEKKRWGEEKGKHILKWRLLTAIMTFPCSRAVRTARKGNFQREKIRLSFHIQWGWNFKMNFRLSY